MARTRPAIRVHLSVADHDKTAEVWADPRLRGMLVELWRKAGEKYAGKRRNRVPLQVVDRMQIAGSTSQVEADEAVSSLCRALKYRVDRHANRWVVTIRNFSKKQGYQPWKTDDSSGPENSQELDPTESESESESDSKSERESSGASAPLTPSGNLPSRKRRPRKLPPDVEAAEAAWPEVRAAFAEHGKQLGERCGRDRAELMAKRLADGATPADLVAAVHGYVREQGGLEVQANGWDPGKFFRPQTVFKGEGFSDRVDAGRMPRAVKRTRAERMWGI